MIIKLLNLLNRKKLFTSSRGKGGSSSQLALLSFSQTKLRTFSWGEIFGQQLISQN